MSRKFPGLVFADSRGKIFSHPELKMLAFDGRDFRLPEEEELIGLPAGSALFFMPARLAFAYDAEAGKVVAVEHTLGKKVFPVSAFLIPGYTRLLHPAAVKSDGCSRLPLWAYTAVGWAGGKFVVTGMKIDSRSRQKPRYYKDRRLLKKNITRYRKEFPGNRLFAHLANCALAYNCLAAQNLFYGRWEAPLPISPTCNARCLGCLSFQEADGSVASHERITFVPSGEEISEVAVAHIKAAREAIVSFGQGCEGEPLLQFKVLKEAVGKIRGKTGKGTIHLNTNAFAPELLGELAVAGLDSVRISLNSFQEDLYNAYYQPRHYGLNDVLESIKVSKKAGLFVSLNLLIFPGVSDTKRELSLLSKFLKKGYIDMLQMRNLCIDADYYLSNIPPVKEIPLGVYEMIRLVRKEFPGLILGYFNLPRERFSSGSSLARWGISMS